MKYMILCGGSYPQWETPKQLMKINNETVVERTIRLLLEEGVLKEKIAISSNDERFKQLGVETIEHENSFVYGQSGYWLDAFPNYQGPAVYLFGDVVFSPAAIHTIVTTEINDVEFFASAPPFDKSQYIKNWGEPFAFKVINYEHFYSSIEEAKRLQDERKFIRIPPISWELWQVIKRTPINQILYDNYTVINDYTCDIDCEGDIKLLQEVITKNG